LQGRKGQYPDNHFDGRDRRRGRRHKNELRRNHDSSAAADAMITRLNRSVLVLRLQGGAIRTWHFAREHISCCEQHEKERGDSECLGPEAHVTSIPDVSR